LDTFNQSPGAASYFLKNIGQLKGAPISVQSIVRLRMGYYVNPQTGARNPGVGGGLQRIADRAEIPYKTLVYQDQTRRQNEIVRALRKTGY
jgi:hypothetical protein